MNMMGIINILPPTVKARPQMIAPVVEALLALHGNMPTHIKESEVKSAMSTLKNAFLAILKYPHCVHGGAEAVVQGAARAGGRGEGAAVALACTDRTRSPLTEPAAV